MFVCLSAICMVVSLIDCPYVCLSICLSVLLSFCSLRDDGLHLSGGHLHRAKASLGHQFGESLFVCLFVSMFVFLSIFMSLCLSVCPSVCLFYCLSVPFAMMAYIYLEVTFIEQKLLLVISLVSHCLSVCLSLCLFVCMSVFLSVPLFPSQ